MIAGLPRSALMVKSDINRPFVLLHVHPSDFDLVFSHYDQFYFDNAPMGCAISCVTFERFSTFLEYCTRKVAESPNIVHYLDDFLFVGASYAECARSLQSFRVVCQRFGVPIAQEKTEGPATNLTFLGLAIDTVARQIQIPTDKQVALQNTIVSVLDQKKITLRNLQSLLGRLNFVCKAVRPGRAFLRRLHDLARGISKPHHKIRITSGARADLLAWQQFLSHFSGTIMFPDSVWYNSDQLHMLKLVLGLTLLRTGVKGSGPNM